MELHKLSALIELFTITPASILKIEYKRDRKSFYQGRELSFMFSSYEDFAEAKDTLSIYFSLEANSEKDLIRVFFGTAWGDDAYSYRYLNGIT